jgi:archaellum component FlaC
MTLEVLLYTTAFVATMLGMLVGGYAFLFHRREFWKIGEWEIMRRDGKTLEALRQQIIGVQAQIDALTAGLADAQDTLRRAATAKAFLDARPTLEAERDALEKTLGDLGEKTRAAIEEKAGLEQRRDQLVKEISALESELTDARALISSLDDLKKKTQAQKDILDAATKETEAIRQTAKASQDQLAKSQQEMVAVEKARAKAVAEQQEAEKIAKEARAEVESAKREVERLAKDRESLTQSIAGMKSVLDKLAKASTGEIVLRQASFETLAEPLFHEKPRQQVPYADEKAALHALKQYVQVNRGFAVSDRLLFAFHTALKTSDISCLTVMAGVSGTGKSALPTMYAQSMGFHFVSLAVEPRWDSPRDLLGFFNYVTNRYEATPMARALLQFGKHRDRGALEPRVDLSEYMLMIMLDEMNLARIEYYFSEFLSKLEMRDRRHTLDDINHLRKVSMEVFAGFKGTVEGRDVQESAIRLYADYNTVFVGTMNEDETTQSLSDKVIDRANVLHFGKPAKLKPNIGQEAAGQQERFKLSRETWVQWQKAVVPESLDEQAGVLRRLNEQLARLGRPFAHRTYQAMLSYLANYPTQMGNGGLNRPLADQIAMRIMPKLRGLDLTMHQPTLAAVKSILQSDVQDAALGRAFDAATDSQQNRSGFFQWQGLDWANEQ